ncbi:CYTH and CHAD domain-containing protein [Acinetobacter pragensis]|uniref:Metal-binding protein n=1 Tax=Acinetobacter pragensis TaxID=1806892 RepID=A0A151XY93_9GAMM|nr:CHAD domain-containing protein [Acinetobacter pragensis]KYQ70801.1 hypothetical protein AZH43_03530 [Acinetobacter pragensis]
MSEIELKFQIPPSKLKALRLAFLRQQPEDLHLHAKYFDTAHLDLQQHQISLRQRKENKIWIQTLKAPKNSIERIEIETELGEPEPSAIDLRPYTQHKKIQQLLKPVLQSHDPLSLQFETHILRQRFLHLQNSSQVELSLDLGKIIAAEQNLEVHEIEFELKEGNIHDLIQAIQPWLKKYQIWLDSQSKAVKGQLLQQIKSAPAVQYQSVLKLKPHADSISALQQMISNCLEHLLPNSSAIALEQYDAGHVHQARVAIRRLRSAFKSFQSPQIAHAEIWQEQLAELFRQLGNTRDRDALAESLIPQLKQAGSPLTELPAQSSAEQIQISAVFRAPSTTRLLLELIEFANSEQAQGKSLKKHIHQQLNKMHRQICQAESAFVQMQASEKHQVRKRVKRMRYSVEFVSSLYPQSEIKQYLKALKPLQENLGRFNDLCVAHALFEQSIALQPKAWFVLGWIASEQKHIELTIKKNLQRFKQVQRFWQPA